VAHIDERAVAPGAAELVFHDVLGLRGGEGLASPVPELNECCAS